MTRKAKLNKYGITGATYSLAEREQIARAAFWNESATPLMDYLGWVNSYKLDGQRHPANSLTLAECIASVAALPNDQIERLTTGPMVPMPGDAVCVTGPCRDAPVGSIAVIDGDCWELFDGQVMATFKSNSFRGLSEGVLTRLPASEIVECGGGPCPFINKADLQYAGRSEEILFWRWSDIPRGGGGVDYMLHVPVWNWDGSEK